MITTPARVTALALVSDAINSTVPDSMPFNITFADQLVHIRLGNITKRPVPVNAYPTGQALVDQLGGAIGNPHIRAAQPPTAASKIWTLKDIGGFPGTVSAYNDLAMHMCTGTCPAHCH